MKKIYFIICQDTHEANLLKAIHFIITANFPRKQFIPVDKRNDKH